MRHFVRILPDRTTQVWRIENAVAVRIGVANAEQVPGACFRAEPNEIIWDAIRRQTPWFEREGICPFRETVLAPGQFYPRMARPIDQHPDEAPGLSPGAPAERNSIAIARAQLIALTRQLDRICQTVQPTEATFNSFGHDIRNLLILACTEVESHWRAVLSANGARGRSTQDYVLLREALKLDEYKMVFPNYPWLASLAPFRGWGTTGNPTQDLPWYDAYNAVKHDRETQFERGTLLHAIQAITACAVMIAAQFGVHEGLGHRSELRTFFEFSAVPSWPPWEGYIYPYGIGAAWWSPIDYPFAASVLPTRRLPMPRP